MSTIGKEAGKLSAAQIAVLERMAGGDELWTTRGRNTSIYWHGKIMDRSPNSRTLWALRSRGLVEDKNHDWRGGKYRITDAGRLALSRAKGEAQ